MASSPSAADEALSTTDEKANFQRLTRLLMRGGLALLREVFDSIHPPPNLPAVLSNSAIEAQLQTLRRNRVITHPEWECLYNPSGPGTYGKSTDFDISLLCKLLREICSLTPPATGWKDLPNITDHSLGADFVRVRIYRNKIYGHNHTMEVTDADFEKLWMEISEALLRIASSISSAKKDEWKNSIEKFFHEPLTPDAKECVDELQLWYLVDMDTKDKLEKLDKKMEQMQIKQEQMKIEQEQRHMEIRIFLESLKESGSAVSSSAQVERLETHMETRISIPPDQSSAESAAGLSTVTELQASQQNIPVVLDFWYVVYSFKRPLELLIRFLKIKLGVDVQSYRLGSLVITVSCSSLEVLEALWNEYRTGRLDEVVQDTLVTRQVLEKLDLSEVKLRTIISEEDYLSYKGFLNYRHGKTETKTSPEPAVFASKLPAGKGKMTIPQVQGSPAMEIVEAKEMESGTRSRKTTPVSRSLLRDLAVDLGTKWRELGKSLGLDNQLLNYFDMENLSLIGKGNAMLGGWKTLNGDAATMEVLQEAMKKIDMGRLMEKVAAKKTVLGNRSRETKPVSRSLLSDLAADLGTKWRELGKILGFADSLLNYFDMENLNLSDKGNAMLCEWKRLNGDDATMDILEEALKKIDMGHLMEKVAGKTVSTTSRAEPTLVEFYARPTHGKPSQVVKGDYIARSGYVLIIDNYPIPSSERFKPTVKSIFAGEFGFTSREDNHLTTSDMLKALTDTAQRDFSNDDCFCCIIRSTGTEHGICGTDDKPIDIKTITSLFTSDKCPSLDGKPKIFVLGPETREYRLHAFWKFKGLPKPEDTEARSILRHLDISEKDFLVWNRFGEVPAFRYDIRGRDWLEGLLMGMHLRRAIEVTMRENEKPLSLLSTLERNVFFEGNNSPYSVF